MGRLTMKTWEGAFAVSRELDARVLSASLLSPPCVFRGLQKVLPPVGN